MATFVLIHGGGGSSWDWHLVVPELQRLDHEAIAVDLPSEDESAGLDDFVNYVVETIGDRTDLVIVAHSLGGITAPLVAERVSGRTRALVMVAAMIPAPGESVSDWWEASGYQAFSKDRGSNEEADIFYHDVSEELAAEAGKHERGVTDKAMTEPWPLPNWPSVPTKVLLATQDRMFPVDFQRQHVRERLGITPDEIDSGHYVPIAHPAELSARLHAYATDPSGAA